jgi:streptogramin lyase
MLEGLESRRLMAVSYASYLIPGGLTPNSITVGPDHNIWFAVPMSYTQFFNDGIATQKSAIGKLDLTTGSITEYPTSTQGGLNIPGSIVSGPGGDLWFIDETSGPKIASIDPTTGTITEFPITISGATPAGLAVGSDGNLWFTDSTTNAVGVFNPTTHTSTEFALPNGAANPGDIVSGPGGNLWFTTFIPSASDYAIADINPTTHAITLAALPNINATPVSITAGPDGNIWFNELFGTNIVDASSKIAMLNTSTHAITEFPGGGFGGITSGPDGNLWYANGTISTNTLNQFDLTTDTPTSFPLPTGVTVIVAGPTLVTGPDNNIYVAADGFIVTAHIIPANQAVLTGTVTEDPRGTNTNTRGIIGQTVFIDLNHDGKVDPGDPTTNTDALGSYTFSGLAPGTYTVSVAPYPGTVVTFPAAGSQTITVTGGQLATVGTLGVIPSSSLLPLTYSPTPFGTNNPSVQVAEVNGVYRMILGRAPDPSGGASAVAYLKAGGPLSQLAADLLTSPEYDGDCVQSFYHNYLDRTPTTAEQTAGIAFLEGGGTQEQLAAQIFDSDEFNTLFPTDAGFVQQLYIDILGRLPAPQEVSSWVSMLGTGTTRPQVVSSIMNSSESFLRAATGQADILFGTSGNKPFPPSQIIYLQGGLTQLQLAVTNFANVAYIQQANATVS